MNLFDRLHPHPNAADPQPIFCLKRDLPAPDERHGLIALNWFLFGSIHLKTYFTRLDQALMLWGGVTAIIFGTVQLSRLTWFTQAAIASILTLGATLATVGLAWGWATVKQARWVIGVWAVLMVGAIALNDYGVFTGNGLILRHLCCGWLGLCGVGYWVTAMGMRSRALAGVGLVHWVAIPVIGAMPSWQFSLTGSTLTLSLWLLGTLQWDHR